MSTRTQQAQPASVVVAVIGGDAGSASRTLTAIDAQVYGTRRAVLIGEAKSARGVATGQGLDWAPSVAGLLDGIEPEASHLWVLRAGAMPRPDALRALVVDSERAGAALAGSKILDGDDEDLLVSVGMATDVFDVPYLGLDEGEVDAGQYDVVRDVAAVDGTSLLIRRDLAKGLRGFDTRLPPQAASIDLSQRARLRSARVVVVPSSEVPYRSGGPAARPWREEAGRIRAMLKSYSVLTLAWALPLAFFIGLFEAVVSPLVGRWTAFNWLRAWLWNLVYLPSTLLWRWRARRGDIIGDVELYRYQLRGSAKLRMLSEVASGRLADRLGPEEVSNLAGLGKELRRPSFVTGAMAALFVAVSTRVVWSGGFPASGYSLPLPSSGADAVAAYAGGWNPGGFGSAEPLPPLIGFAGALQRILFDNPELTTAVLILGAFLSGVWGSTRLLRTWAVGPVGGIVAGIALMAGPAARAVAADTGVGTLLALGALPWALRIPLLRWPGSWRQRAGRLAAAAFACSIVGLLSPPMVLVPAGALVLWALLNAVNGAPWRAAAVALGGGLLALPVLLPWLDSADVNRFLADGAAFWEPGLVLAVAFGVTFLATVASVPSQLGRVTAWGGVLVGLGAILARSGDFGPGREVEHLGLGIVSLGIAIVIGVAIEGVRRVEEIRGWRRVLVGLGGVAASVIAASALLVVAPGRAGLPSDDLSDRIGFTNLAEGNPSDSRILVIGPPEVLPGESREVRGAGYRVVSAPMPEMWEAWLPDMQAVDMALQADLEAMIDGEVFRAGEVLAPYAIRWVISLGATPLEEVFGAQLDLVPLGIVEGVAFTTEGEPAVRAVTADGAAWTRVPAGYDGDPGPGRVLLAESADPRWQPEGAVEGWATSVSAIQGEARFIPSSRRRDQATAAAVVFGLLALLAFVGRRRPA